jgi:tetratricopeptide (TPR) repeat protein
MKKEELKYDPVHDKIAAIIDYINNNKNFAIQGLIVIGLAVGGWGYYSGLEKDKINISKSQVGVAQNAYNGGEVDLSISELKSIVEEYSGTDAANQALVYLLKDAYQKNNDELVFSLADEHGGSGLEAVLNAGFYETLGNADMNMNDFNAAINTFKKADKIASTENGESRFKIDLAIALIAKNRFADAVAVLKEILDDENISYSDKNRAEELLALANFSKDN